MNTHDLQTAERLLGLAGEFEKARDLAISVRAMGLVRAAEWFRAKGEARLVDAWLDEAGLPHGQSIDSLARPAVLHLHRRAFALAEALHLLAQAKKQEVS